MVLFAVLAEGLFRTHGHYKTNRVIFITLALFGFGVSTIKWGRGLNHERQLQLQLGGLFLLGAGLLTKDPRLLYAEQGWALDGIHILSVAVLGISVGTLLLSWRGVAAKTQVILLFGGIGALVLARVLVLVASPHPHIDVFDTPDRAVDFLLSGLNPYVQAYPDIYNGKYDYTPGLPYWPGTLVAAALGKLVFGDIRAAYIIGDLLGAGALFVLAVQRAQLRLETGLLAAAVWLAFPVSLFVAEQAWVDPLVLAGFLWAAVALDARRFVLAGALLGAATVCKQPALLAVFMTTALILATRPKDGIRFTAAGVTVGLLVAGPFLVADPAGLWRMTVTVPLGQLMRTDAMTLVALMQREWQVGWPGWASGLLYLTTLGGLLFRLVKTARGDLEVAPAYRWLPAMALLYGVVFLFGKQAFCNYWALAAGLVLATRVAFAKPPIEAAGT